MLTRCQGYGPAGAAKFVGNLRSRGRGANHEYAAIVELVRIAVLHRGEGFYVGRQRLGNFRHPRDIACAGGNHDGVTLPCAFVRDDFIAITATAQRRYFCLRAYGR